MHSPPGDRDGRLRSANVNTLWAHVLVDELIRCGLRRAVIAPGSRSAPLVFQFAARPEIDDVSIIDERSAAFFALGMSRSLGEPVALLCTSGTAAANFYPAVCEASADDVPLLVLTGDRPPEDHDCGVQQVMDQHALYGNRVRMFHQMAQPDPGSVRLAYLRSTVCRAWNAALGPRAGPVHLDLPFDKPLEPTDTGSGESGALPPERLRKPDPALEGRADGAPFVRRARPTGDIDGAALDRIAERIDRCRRPVLLAGTDHRSGDYRDALRGFAERAGIPVMAEATSGLRHWGARGDHVFGALELLTDGGVPPSLEADLVIRTGHPPLTWGAQRWLAGRTDALHVQIGRTARLLDPERLVSEQLVGGPGAIFTALRDRVASASGSRRERLADLRGLERTALAALERAIEENGALSTPRLWFELGGLLPRESALVFSSSMLVRHLETFMCGHADSLAVHFNRGLNGIDGVVATAAGICAARAGASYKDAGPTVLVIGDVALRHDIASLLVAVEQELDLTVIVADNGGGEIFEYLPSAAFPGVHEKHFATAEALPIPEILPRAVPLSEPADWNEFRACVGRSIARGGVRLIRIATERRGDVETRRRLMRSAADALSDPEAVHDRPGADHGR